MKIGVLTLFILIFTTNAWSGNYVLLTSLPVKDEKIVKRVEKIFLSQFKESEQVRPVLVHKADQETLYHYLNDPNTEALFWVSHGAGVSRKQSTVMSVPMLLDHEGNNVAKIFGKINPKLKFLSVVGCQSAQILKGILPPSSTLESYLPTKKVLAGASLKKAIKIFKKIKPHDTGDASNLAVETFPIKIVRTPKPESKILRSFQIHIGGKLVGLFPKAQSNSNQELIINFPVNKEYQSKDLKITLETGQNAADEENYFGDVTITSNFYDWKLFAKADGEAFGVSERIFLLWNKKQ